MAVPQPYFSDAKKPQTPKFPYENQAVAFS